MPLEEISRAFEACVREAGVFERDVPGGSLVEADVLRKENKSWVAVAAGIGREDADALYPVSSKRARRATTPVNVLGGGQASFLFVVRPVPQEDLRSPTQLVTPFLPRGCVPFVEIRQGAFLRLWGLNPGEARLASFRWELDSLASSKEPLEEWLREWDRELGFNPTHAPSHVHVNSPPLPPDSGADSRAEHSPQELRLAVGAANPLALILSLACWIRKS